MKRKKLGRMSRCKKLWKGYEDEFFMAMSTSKSAHTNTPQSQHFFLRALPRSRNRKISIKSIIDAGYPVFHLTQDDISGKKWQAIHAWCKDNLLHYTWAGGDIVFLSQEDYNKFINFLKNVLDFTPIE